MKVDPLRSPLDGEQVVAIDPPLIPRVDAGWRRRLHLFTGRSLDASALAAEQRARAARSALLAQALSPGIVTGLEASLEGADYDGAMLDVAPGLGITAWGEDVRLPRALRVRLGEIQVVAPDGGGAGLTLNEIVDGGFLPPVLVLVLQPVLVEEIGAADPLDPCERDPQSEAFEDQRTVDACRPLLVSWPEREDWSLPAAGLRWRNQLAWAVFERALLGPLPWEDVGAPARADRKRPGAGNPLPRPLHRGADRRPAPAAQRPPAAGGRSRPLAGAHPAVRRASGRALRRSVDDRRRAAARIRAPAPGRAAAASRRPPSPARSRARPTRTAATISSSPAVPRGRGADPPRRAGAGLRRERPLAPLDFAKAEEVQLLVPVPGALYDPDLLIQERVDPEFATTLAEFRADREPLAGPARRRARQGRALTRALGGTEAKPPFAEDDPDKQADEAPRRPRIRPEEIVRTIVISGRPRLPWPCGSGRQIDKEFRFNKIQKEWDEKLLDAKGLDGLIRVLANKVSKANDKIDLGFLHLQTEIYRVRQIVLGNVAGTRLATSPVLADIAQGESARATRENISKIFAATKPEKSQEPLPGRAAQAQPAQARAPEPMALASAAPVVAKADAERLSVEREPSRRTTTTTTVLDRRIVVAKAEEKLDVRAPVTAMSKVEAADLRVRVAVPDDIRQSETSSGCDLRLPQT